MRTKQRNEGESSAQPSTTQETQEAQEAQPSETPVPSTQAEEPVVLEVRTPPSSPPPIIETVLQPEQREHREGKEPIVEEPKKKAKIPVPPGFTFRPLPSRGLLAIPQVKEVSEEQHEEIRPPRGNLQIPEGLNEEEQRAFIRDQWRTQTIEKESEAAMKTYRQAADDCGSMATYAENIYMHCLGQNVQLFQHPQALTATINEVLQSFTRLSTMTLIRDKGAQAAEEFAEQIVISQRMKMNAMQVEVRELRDLEEYWETYATQLLKKIGKLEEEMEALKATSTQGQAAQEDLKAELDRLKEEREKMARELAEVADYKQSASLQIQNLNEELSQAREDLWQSDLLLQNTRTQLEASESNLRVVMQQRRERPRATSVAPTIVTADAPTPTAQEMERTKGCKPN